MSTKRFFLYLILFLISKSTSQNIPPKTAFKELESNKYQEFIITKNNSHEVYFKFKYDYENSDLSVSLTSGLGYTVRLYVFTDYQNISKLDDGNYTGFKTQFTLTQRTFAIKAQDLKCGKGELYFIIKDIKQFYYRDYIKVFNEKEIFQISDNKPFVINQFLSQNELNFAFKLNEGESAQIILKKENEEKSTDFYIYKGTELIYNKTSSDNVIFNLNNTSGDFKINIKSKNSYVEISQTLLIYIGKSKYGEIFPNISKEVFYIEPHTFYFYADLSKYKLNEENTVTLKVDFQISSKYLLNSTFGKIISTDNFNEKLFDEELAKAELDNKIIIKRESDSDTYYTIYFKNLNKTETGKKNYLIFRIYTSSENFKLPKSVSVGLSHPIISKTFSKKEESIKEDIKIDQDIPVYYEYTLESHKELSYILYTSLDDVFTLYNNTLLYYSEKTKEYSVNYKKIDRKIIVLPKSEDNHVLKYTVKLFGSNATIQFKIDSLKSNIEYLSSSHRYEKRINYLLKDCTQPFYVIEDYLNEQTGYFVLEQIYGKMDVYYKYDFNSIENIFPTKDDIVKENIFSTDVIKRSIIKFQCTYPSSFNLHFVDIKSNQENIGVNERKMIVFNKDDINNIIFPSNTNNCYYELYTPYDTEIKCKIEGEKIFLNKTNKYYQNEYKSSPNETYITCTSKDLTVLQIKTNNKEYIELTEGIKEYQGNYFILPFKSESKHKSISINSENISSVFYEFGKQKNPSKYTTIPENSGSEIKNLSKEFSYILSNPYDQYTPQIFNDEQYYLTISTNNNQSIKFNVKFTEKKYDEIKPSTLTFTNNNPIKTSENHESNMFINVFILSCTNKLSSVNLQVNDDISESIKFDLNKKVNLLSAPNFPKGYEIVPIMDSLPQLKFNYNEIFYIYGTSVKNESLNILNKNYSFTKISDKSVKWDPVGNTTIANYYVYSFETNFVDMKYINNECYLNSIRKSYDPQKKQGYTINETNATKYVLPNNDK